MKKHTVVLVDGENISAKRADEILSATDRLGYVSERKVYHRQKDPSTRPWTEKTKTHPYKDICLFGEPEKDKVDRKMQKDARQYLKSPQVGTVCVVTSDAGFRCLAEDAKVSGKKLCIIGEKKAPKRLRLAGSQFIELS